MKWFKKWSFLCSLLLSGMIFLAADIYQATRGGISTNLDLGFVKEKWLKLMRSGVDDERVNDEMDEKTSSDAATKADSEFQMEDVNIQDSTNPTDLINLTDPETSTNQILNGSETIHYRDPSEVTYETVTDEYFADALFIGDSRTVGMFEYGGLEEIATFYASTGLTVYKIFDDKIATIPQDEKPVTIEEALQTQTFSKVYLMIGINEMGTGTAQTFLNKYSEVVTHLQELLPDAIFYLQGILKVSAKRSEQGDYINNEGIEVRNAGIAALCDQVHTYYLDVNAAVCDENGALEQSFTFDGVHLKARYIPLWKEYLQTHAVNIP
ncbi:MAG: GDSL-type esterase/lipase family protein [Clostridium sp.]|jgi:hypothetical protein|nr:GDSL-type esterase/lipase family protein [Clostridium sp.]